MSCREFVQLISNYQPLPFEIVVPTEQRRFHVPMHYALKNCDRLWLAIETASRYFPPGPFTVADLGTYPGSLLRLLRHWYPSERCRLLGIGLMVSDDFRQAMAKTCEAHILTVNLDPRNDQLQGKGYPTRVPIEDGCVEFIFALEVVEHLVSPAHLFAEAFRLLAPGGHLLITTPNVTRIGNVFKLAIGRSNFDRLIPPDYFDSEDEWRPHFREYTMAEIGGFFSRAGFQVVERRWATGENTRYNVKSITQRCIDLAKIPFYVVPHFREGLLMVGQKPAR